MNPAVMAALGSVMLSWYYFFVRGDRMRGIFVGLWPPTFLAFASYFELEQITAKLEHVTGGRLMDRIEGMIQNE